jgi:hypothetical protein
LLTHTFIRTNTKWSLYLLSGLSPTIYSTLLLECELVSIRTNREDGTKSVRLARDKWIVFLNRCGLRGEDAEFTDGKINHSTIFDDRDDSAGTCTVRMPLLRVGKVRPGKSPPWNTAINSGDQPPRISHAMRDVKMRLIKATMNLIVVDQAKREDVSAVEQWVLMQQNAVTVVNASGSKRKHGENCQPNETPTTAPPLTPSMKTPSQNSTSTMITPSSNMVQSPDERCSLSEEFPVLASFNPCLLQRGSRVLVNGVDLDHQLAVSPLINLEMQHDRRSARIG